VGNFSLITFGGYIMGELLQRMTLGKKCQQLCCVSEKENYDAFANHDMFCDGFYLDHALSPCVWFFVVNKKLWTTKRFSLYHTFIIILDSYKK
jgi:hypothetical protein